jgi:DNA-binding protein H-NS
MSIDIESMSAKELAAFIAKASQLHKKLKKRKPATAVRKQISTIARQAGYTIAELFGSEVAKSSATGKSGKSGKTAKPAKAAKKAGRKSGKAGSKVAPKYRNPSNHAETWAARGKQPRWLAAEIAKGRSLEEFKI